MRWTLWSEWANGPQFGTPLYNGPFVQRFPDRIERVLDAVEQARPGGVLFHCVGGRDRTGLVAIILLAVAGVAPEAAGPTCPACCLASSRGRGRPASGTGARARRFF